MGVYADDIQLENSPVGPFALRLVMYSRVSLDPGEQVPDRVDFSVSLGEQEIARGSGPVSVPEPGRPITLVVALNPVILPSLGRATLELRLTSAGEQVGKLIVHRTEVVGPQTTGAPAVP
ncbi:MAG: hypothetical protein ABSC94_30545 [Polyangiaceae bacterium]